jgi:hypothetical protein
MMDSGKELNTDLVDEDGFTLEDMLYNFHGLSLSTAKVLGRQWLDNENPNHKPRPNSNTFAHVRAVVSTF